MKSNWGKITPEAQAIADSSNASNMPPVGSVVRAKVIENIGKNIYLINWAGNKIAVTSKITLEVNQEMLLKSEVNDEGKILLVVQVPEEVDVDNTPKQKIIYANLLEQQIKENKAVRQMEIITNQEYLDWEKFEKLIAEFDHSEQKISQVVNEINEPAIKVVKNIISNSMPENLENTVLNDDKLKNVFNTVLENKLEEPASREEALQELQKTIEQNKTVFGGIEEKIGIDKNKKLQHIPSSVADKAVQILLRSVGLGGGKMAEEAVKTLLEYKVPVERGNIQSLLQLGGMGKNTQEIKKIMQAAARSLARDIPIIAPVVSGLAKIISKESGRVSYLALAEEEIDSLQADGDIEKENISQIKKILQKIDIDINSESKSKKINEFVTDLAKEKLSKIENLLEKTVAHILEKNSELKKIDQIINILLKELGKEKYQTETTRAISKGEDTAEKIKTNTSLPEVLEENSSEKEAKNSELSKTNSENLETKAEKKVQNKNSIKNPENIFSHPGVNKVESELLKNNGFIDKLYNWAEKKYQHSEVDSKDVEKIINEIINNQDENSAKKVLQNVVAKENKGLLLAVLEKLGTKEKELIEKNTQLTKLAAVSENIRKAGREMLAIKAENLAAQEHNPGFMLVELPIKFADKRFNARLQVFYKKNKKKNIDWSSRVIFDLVTTKLGSILADAKFYQNQLNLNFFLENNQICKYLEKNKEELVVNLKEKGYKLAANYLLLPQTANKTVKETENKNDNLPNKYNFNDKLDLKI